MERWCVEAHYWSTEVCWSMLEHFGGQFQLHILYICECVGANALRSVYVRWHKMMTVFFFGVTSQDGTLCWRPKYAAGRHKGVPLFGAWTQFMFACVMRVCVRVCVWLSAWRQIRRTNSRMRDVHNHTNTNSCYESMPIWMSNCLCWNTQPEMSVAAVWFEWNRRRSQLSCNCLVVGMIQSFIRSIERANIPHQHFLWIRFTFRRWDCHHHHRRILVETLIVKQTLLYSTSA